MLSFGVNLCWIYNIELTKQEKTNKQTKQNKTKDKTKQNPHPVNFPPIIPDINT